MSSATKQTALLICAILAIVATIFGAVTLAKHQTSSSAKTVSSQTCKTGQHTAHKVVIKNDAMDPNHTNAKLCDTLTITNLDDEERLIAFGKHDHHVFYDGVEERSLTKGQSFTVTLNETGTYKFHDHEHDEVQGTFTVN